MSTHASLFFASNERVTVHLFHDFAEDTGGELACYLEVQKHDDCDVLSMGIPCHFLVKLPRVVGQALRQWIIDSKIANCGTLGGSEDGERGGKSRDGKAGNSLPKLSTESV